jgi:hypothetical protein
MGMKKVYSVVIESDGYPWVIGQFDDLEEAYAVYNEYQNCQPCEVAIKTSFVNEDK